MSVVARDIVMSYGDRRVLDNASFVFPESSTTAIMGPSGSGKSTFLSLVSGLVEPSSGTIMAEGRIDWLVQSSPLFQRRTAIDNVMVSLQLEGIPTIDAIPIAMRAMMSVNIASLAREKTFRLSGGEKQRVAIARAIASESKVLLADEPTASLDPNSRELVCEALQAIARSGTTVLVATHDEFVAQRCDEIAYLDRGKLVSRKDLLT